jgi:adenylosuccinate synthase
MLETIYENAKGEGRTGTTKRGIGPVYADKVSYNGIRLFDLQNKAIFSEKLNVQLSVKNPILEAFGFKALEASAILREKFEQYEAIQPFVREPFGLMQTTLAQGANVLLEGAQAALLDTDWGTYPFSTASTTLSGGANAGLGIAPHWISRVIGVAKAYTTRVGGGPMPSELFDSTGQMLIQEGGEYGTVTGRPRRCGWFDAELVRFTAQLNGFDEVVLTKLDVLDKLPKIKICIGYRNSDKGSGKGQTEKAFFHYWEGDASWLEQCEPVYTELDGWRQSTKAVREFHRLPKEAQVYIRKIEELISVPVHLVSVGPARDEIITVPPLH